MSYSTWCLVNVFFLNRRWKENVIFLIFCSLATLEILFRCFPVDYKTKIHKSKKSRKTR